MKYEHAQDVMKKFQAELIEMKKEAQPGDTMPAEVFFMFMDTLIPAFEAIIEEIEKKVDVDVSK